MSEARRRDTLPIEDFLDAVILAEEEQLNAERAVEIKGDHLRIQREIATKKELLRLADQRDVVGAARGSGRDYTASMIRIAIANVYSDQPGYRQNWES